MLKDAMNSLTRPAALRIAGRARYGTDSPRIWGVFNPVPCNISIVQPGIQFQKVLRAITSTKITIIAYFLLLSAPL